jgi:oligopeptide transport system substrate-binding protein
MKKKLGMTLLVMTPMLLAACGTKSPDTFTVCLASFPDTIDPALNSSVDGGTYDSHLFEGLYHWSYTGTYPDGAAAVTMALAKDVAEADNTDGTVTYTYTLRDGLKWSDGTDLTAADFVRSWKRAVSGGKGGLGGDYAYLFEAIKGGADAEGEADGASLAVSATDSTHLVVTLVTKITYWNELLAFPTFSPVPASADLDGTWAAYTNASKFVCNGPMKIKAFDQSKLEMVPNPNYWDPTAVKAKDLTFAFSDDSQAMYNSYLSGSYAFIDDFPPTLIDTISAKYPKQYFNVGQLGTYYACFNINSTAFDSKLDTEPKKEAFRKALCLLIDRNYIVNSVTKGGQKPANGFVSEGLTDSDGKTDWTAKNGAAGDGTGYYDASAAAVASNKEKAIAILKDTCGFTYDSTKGVFTDIPSFEYLYNNSKSHELIAQAIQSNFKALGITMTLTNQEWATFLTTRKSGNYTAARNGWLCDYNDPISMLDMWTSQSGNNDVQLGKGANATYAGYSVDLNNDGTIGDGESGLTWAQSYDVLIKTIKSTADNTARFKMMHNAETLLMSTGTICPIYYYTDLFLKKEGMTGYFGMPLGFKFFYGATNN